MSVNLNKQLSLTINVGQASLIVQALDEYVVKHNLTHPKANKNSPQIRNITALIYGLEAAISNALEVEYKSFHVQYDRDNRPNGAKS